MTDDNKQPAELWCVHIAGPDDVVPVTGYQHAVAMANWLNNRWARHIRVDFSENDPHLWASPRRWPYADAEMHARYLATPNSDYGDVLAATTPGGGLRVACEDDGFVGMVIGEYRTKEHREGYVVQQDRTRVVHVYGRARLKPALEV